MIIDSVQTLTSPRADGIPGECQPGCALFSSELVEAAQENQHNIGNCGPCDQGRADSRTEVAGTYGGYGAVP